MSRLIGEWEDPYPNNPNPKPMSTDAAGFPHHVDTSAAVGSYWLGLARQQMQFQQVLGELVDNAFAAPKKDRDGDNVPFRIEVVVICEDSGIKLTVADDGHGISLDDLENKVLRPGGQGTQKGILNEHGFGLKNALCMLTRNQDGFAIRTRDETSTYEGKHYLVRGPFSPETTVDLEESSSWNENLTHVGENIGTRILAETSYDFFQTLYVRGQTFGTLMTRLLEHLGVMYRHYLSDSNNKLWVRWKDVTAGATSFVETRVRPIKIPYVRSKATKTYSFEIPNGDQTASATYEYGILDHGARQTASGTDWDPTTTHPFPLMMYYKGNTRTQGIDIAVRDRVLLNGIMERIWEDVPRHNDWNDFVGELRLDENFRTVNNKTDVDGHNPYWIGLLEVLADHDTYMPERATRAKSEKELKQKMKIALEANVAHSEAHVEWPVGGGIGVKIDIYHKKPARHVDVYEAKMGTSSPLDLYQLLMYWDLVALTSVTIDSGRLIADEHTESVKRLAYRINQRKDAKGRKYNLIVKKAAEVLPR